MCTAAKKYRMLEVPVNNVNGLEFAFPLDEVLGEVACKITAVEAYPASALAFSPVTGAPVVNTTIFQKSTITLQTKANQDVIINVPLQRINPAANNGQPFRLDIPGGLNPTKCRVRVGTTAGLVLGEVWAIGFWYE